MESENAFGRRSPFGTMRFFDKLIAKETAAMKRSKASVRGKATDRIEVRFEDQQLTAHAGLVLYQRLFARLALKERLRGCFRHLPGSPAYAPHAVALLLVVHLVMGFRELRDARHYRDDEMVRRTLGLRHLPEVSTVSRMLKGADARSADNVRGLNRELVLDRLAALGPRRVTLDFDGSVLGTGRAAEGAAVGFNKRRKGQRSYYPLFATVAQTGQVFDVHHRPGNVHDSNGAEAFMERCVARLREALPDARLESRMDSAFFGEDILDRLDALGVEYTASVPFERFTALKSLVEDRRRWRRIDGDRSFFEPAWKPRSWGRRRRLVVVRTRTRLQRKGPVQLDLFAPHVRGWEFKVIVTNRRVKAKAVVAFHDGRGSQEAVFGELKSQCRMDYVPTKRLAGNRIYMLAAVLAHNLTRELQMASRPPQRGTSPKRAALWAFEQMRTVRRRLVRRPGRLVQPQRKPVLSMNADADVETEMSFYLAALA